jgi:hypothetical protein
MAIKQSSFLFYQLLQGDLMARKRKKEISSQKLREILRLGMRHQLGNREIARSCSVSHVTVGANLRQVKDSNLT